MAGVETIGLVCNILELIHYACDTCMLCKSIYDGRSPDKSLKENAKSLEVASSEVKNRCLAQTPKTPEEKELYRTAKRCTTAAHDVQKELGRIEGERAAGSVRASMWVAVKARWWKSRVEEAQKTLDQCRATMNTHIIAKVWYV
jgi:hypothetical protein